MEPHPQKSTRNPVTLPESPILQPQRGQHHSPPQGSQLPPSWFICLRASFIGSKGRECTGFVTCPTRGTRPPLRASGAHRDACSGPAEPLPGVLPAPHSAPIHCSYSTPSSQRLPQPPDEVTRTPTPVMLCRHHPLSSPLRNECPFKARKEKTTSRLTFHGQKDRKKQLGRGFATCS